MMNPLRFKFILAIFMVWLMLQANHVCAEKIWCKERERLALLDFKSGLVDNFGFLSSWGSQEECCLWAGVSCSNRTGHVQHLDLHGDAPYGDVRLLLKGEIHSSLLQLQHLEYLNLGWNCFQGSHIPEFFASLHNLEYLDLSYSYFSGQVPSQLGSLSHLLYLNLEGNQLEGSIPYQLGNLSNLQYLLLCDNRFEGKIPSQLGKLSSLKVLRLGRHDSFGALKIDNGGGQWLSNLTSLTNLDLSGVLNLNNSHNWLQMIGKLPYLEGLILEGCFLSDHLIHSVGAFKFINSSSLQYLVLSDNNFESSPSIFQWVSGVSPSLVVLELINNQLEGPIPNDFGTTMISLQNLYLSGNRLKGKDLKSLANMCTLRELYLSTNSLAEELSTILQNLSAGCARHSLQVLHLNMNQIAGRLSDLSIFPSLKELSLAGNQLSGKIPEGSKLPSQLEYLSIGSNFLTGGIPKSFGDACSLRTLRLLNNSLSEDLPGIIHHLSGCATNSLQELYLNINQINGTLPDLSIFPFLEMLELSENKLKGKIYADYRFPSQLETLALSSNSLEGVITDSHFANMSKLKHLRLSDNPLALVFSQNWLPPFQLEAISLRSCKFGPAFPKWLETQNSFTELDISHSGISDVVPEWFWAKLAFPIQMSVNISCNNLKGTIPNLPIRLISMSTLTLSSNQFEGSIPPFLRDARFLDLSNNKFSDSLLFFCANGTVEKLGQLILSNTELSGSIPDCLSRFKSLAYLNLSHNKFTGKIPTSIGSLIELQALVLRNNSLTGEIPFSLRSCTSLLILDLGENRLSGPIPSWIGRLQQLIMVSLDSNHFFGSLPLNLCHLTSLHLLDLSLNNLSGKIPSCFKNFSAMAQKNSQSDYDARFFTNIDGITIMGFYVLNANLMWKGEERTFWDRHLLLKSIDLSSNQLSGQIPTEIVDLFELVSINLSRNSLSGKIPSMVGKLASLEFLDLSRNQLFGSIPSSLAQINRLTMLDLSHNHLAGVIPTGTQLQSFNASSYEDNLDLCGPPLPKMCKEEKSPPIVHEDEDEDSLFSRGFYISMALGFATGFWGIFGSILVNRPWRHAYFRFLNNLMDKIYVMIAVKVAKCRRRLEGVRS